MNTAEKFAVSLVSLALVRNGYSTYEDVPCANDMTADILAIRQSDTTKETFEVQISAVRDRRTIFDQLESLRAKYQSGMGHGTSNRAAQH